MSSCSIVSFMFTDTHTPFEFIYCNCRTEFHRIHMYEYVLVFL